MDENGKVETLDSLINNERGSIRWSLISAIGLFVIGVVISVVIYYITLQPEGSADTLKGSTDLARSNTDALSKLLLGIPPLVTAFTAGFPIKDYFAKKNKITFCQFLKIAYKSPPVPVEIDKRFWTLMDKI